jgi:antitoxin (DNA-binding transcriptional repressor) of toxin-antitoxin stability system
MFRALFARAVGHAVNHSLFCRLKFAMITVTIHAAKTNLSKLLARVEAGEEIVIARGKTTIARLSPIRPTPAQRRFGAMKGIVTVGPQFFGPMTAEELEEWVVTPKPGDNRRAGSSPHPEERCAASRLEGCSRRPYPLGAYWNVLRGPSGAPQDEVQVGSSLGVKCSPPCGHAGLSLVARGAQKAERRRARSHPR